MFMRVLGFGLLALLLAAPSFGEEYWKLAPVKGVRIGKLAYVASESKAVKSLEQAITDAFEVPKGDTVPYQFNLIELAKGKQHALVVLEGPGFGGSGGSSAGLFEKTAQGFRLVTRFTLFRTPVVVANSSSKGYKDLVVRTSGGGMPAQFSLLKFDGQGYPSNPSTATALGPGSQLTGTAYLASRLSADKSPVANVLKFVSAGPSK